jgi:hypothetical protein
VEPSSVLCSRPRRRSPQPQAPTRSVNGGVA